MIGESAQAILQRRSQQAEANRRQMPVTSGIVDELRANQGDPPFAPRVVFAEEAGRTVGTPLPQGVVPVVQSRATDPDTSKKAAEGFANTVAKHEAWIFDAIHHAGLFGATAKEIATRINLTHEQVNRRMSSMAGIEKGVQVRIGVIKRNGDKRDGACVWIKA